MKSTRATKNILAGISSPWSGRFLINTEQNLANEPLLKLLSHFRDCARTRYLLEEQT
jgi:hypothetical protein